MKSALRAGEKDRLSVIRMLLAAIQSREIDARAELSDADVLSVVEKLVKQRKDSAQQFADAGRPEREAAELAEAEQLQGYLPEQMGQAEIAALVDKVIADTGASGMSDMGKVMGALKSAAQGKADMGAISALVKEKLAGN